ncbi:hypothetical protein B0J11DRAFT_595904 [Dendryphion nanum]|uniref:Uncharacterized protein n=1 Tax=Dendryphion nanum TaxID=256645 RepID=A0A9P9EDC7_9PLEO|nr:hypothetical protein B0J11DRAFT_595904 [Dendryphion nanum]
MDPLLQYPSHAFIPYLLDSTNVTPSSQGSSLSTSPSTNPPLSVHQTATWSYIGPLLTNDSSSLPPTFHTWSSNALNGSILPRLLPFLDFLHQLLKSAGVECYWLTIRATKPTSEFNMPRWHVDDNFFSTSFSLNTRRGQNQAQSQSQTQTRTSGYGDESLPAERKYWKLATTLLGPSTLFLPTYLNPSALTTLSTTKAHHSALLSSSSPTGSHTCTSLRCDACFSTSQDIRSSLATLLESHPTVSPSEKEGAVHSEPQCGVDRVFVNVVPGVEKEMRELMGRWGMKEWPRAWCLGIPTGREGFMEKR